MSPLDLHVLGTPPAFVLSQDQTLVFNPSMSQSKFPFRFPFPSTLNSSESSLSFAASPASLPLPPPGFPFRSASPRLLSSCAFLSSVSFSRFGPLPRSGSFRTLSRASLDRIPNFSLPVNPFFEFFYRNFCSVFFPFPTCFSFFNRESRLNPGKEEKAPVSAGASFFSYSPIRVSVRIFHCPFSLKRFTRYCASGQPGG